MRVIESTLALSPFDVDNSKSADWEFNIFGSAAGRAYLAALEDAQVLRLVDEQRDDPRWALTRCGIDAATLLRELRDIRRMGYAARRAGYHARPGTWRHNAIAVAICDARQPIGALNLRWRKSYLPAEKFARKYLAELRSAAASISADLAKLL